MRKTERDNATHKFVRFLALLLTPAAVNTKHIEYEMSWTF